MISARSYPIRAAFRPGTRDVSVSQIHARLQDDDDDADGRRPVRRVLGDDDLLAYGGTDCVVRVFQREGAATDNAARRKATRRKRRMEQRRHGEGGDEQQRSEVGDASRLPEPASGHTGDASESDAESDDEIDAVDADATGDDAVGRFVQLQALEGHRDVDSRAL